MILDVGFDSTKTLSFIHLYCVCKIREIWKSGRSDGDFLAVPESILKVRLSYFVFRIIRRLDPLVIDLRRYACMKNGVSAISCSDVIGAVARLNGDREALDSNNDLRSLGWLRNG